jgi:formate hydrogenlyase transcriptional activator
VKLNCAAIPFDLLESELFGHEKGAFTEAVAQRLGRFEMADTGTLFLDEIGDLPLALQPKLLRILQEQEFERSGSGCTHRINVRLVAATHRDLAQMVARDEFRSDLYYRLNVFPVLIPPLRKRRDDIPQLVLHFVEVFSRRMGKAD